MSAPAPAPFVGFDWDAPRFPSVEACMAIGCNTQWLADLISGSPAKFPLGEDEIIERPQRRRFLFKFRTVFHLALINRLRAFLSAKDAADAASFVVHSDYLFAEDLSPNGGDVFLVVVGLAIGSPYPVYCPAVVPGAYLGEVLGTSGGRTGSPRIVFNVTPVFDQVVKGLGL